MHLPSFDFTNDPSFYTGLGLGSLGATGAVAARLAVRHRRSRVAVGVLVVAAAAAGIWWRVGLPIGVVLALLLLAGSGQLFAHRVTAGGLFVATGAAWLLAVDGGLEPQTWIRAALVTLVPLGAWALSDFDRAWADRDRGYPVLLAGISAAGMYFTVPDPYRSVVLFGAILPFVILSWPRPLVRLGPGGACALAGLMCWVVATDGPGRQSSIVGGLACLGLLLVEPLSRGLYRTGRSALHNLPVGPAGAAVVAAAQLALVFVASRVAGVRQREAYRAPHYARGGVRDAVGIVVVESLVALAALVMLRVPERWEHRSTRLGGGVR